ncbi:GNAT family N-acetyltransferase [Pseudoalteromonas denitrificans]|uniref:Acetyltransferase (GNAT) family protein n=1 Tax=Pseudoalteromonas denitrificans DSM 6059 TaxID=1123010 RepID=A0A1I1M661_9GAMM|nr:GNAT family N-acetyltransferase [Pseudoalteromonas denitrificans]SFC78073.1 Acetyltransferase (GNAT) family protein [Pseudoalteromonas denitrificans DSM 6059]
MQIIQCNEQYLAQLVILFEEYRLFCNFKANPKATEKFLRSLIIGEDSVIFIAVDSDSDELMGFVNLYPSYSSLALKRLWILNDLGVSQNFRGKNVSKALISRVLSFAKETHAVRIELKTEKTNERALQLYKTMGFEIDIDNVYYRVPS